MSQESTKAIIVGVCSDMLRRAQEQTLRSEAAAFPTMGSGVATQSGSHVVHKAALEKKSENEKVAMVS